MVDLNIAKGKTGEQQQRNSSWVFKMNNLGEKQAKVKETKNVRFTRFVIPVQHVIEMSRSLLDMDLNLLLRLYMNLKILKLRICKL